MEKTTIQADVFGHTYQGLQTVTGTRKRYQEVAYEGRTKPDSYCYRPDETDYMNEVAKHLLIELVRESIE